MKMKHQIRFLVGAAFLACHATATTHDNSAVFYSDSDTTNTTNNSTEIDDEAAFAKLFYAKNSTTAIKNSFLVAFNKILVEDLNETVNELATHGIVVDKLMDGMKMVKMTVNATESGDDEDAAREERKANLLPWLKSSLIEFIEEVRAGNRLRTPPAMVGWRL